MFTKRRPIPSARTVRLLYQLGYICSGTAFGLVTLCLEEQRRRIQILQRISDNAKILRQHPRYKGNVALAVQAGDDWESGAFESGWMSERSARRRKRWEQAPGEVNEDAAQHPALPSVVEREYLELFGRGQKGSSQHAADQSSQTDAVPVQRNRAQNLSHLKRLNIEREFRTGLGHTTKTDDAKDLSGTKAVKPDSLPNTMSYKTLRRARLVESVSPRERRSFGPETVNPAAGINQESGHFALTSDFATRGNASIQLDSDDIVTDESLPDISPQDLSHDITLFLSSATSEALLDRRSTNDIIFNKLFRFALDVGSLDEIRSLYGWKLAKDSLSKTDARALCTSCTRLGERFGPDALNSFLAEIFKSKSFSGLNKTFRVELALEGLGGLLDWNVDAKTCSFYRTLLDDLLNPMEDDAVREALGKVCRDFVSHGQVPVASRLFLLICESRTHRLLFIELNDEILHAAIATSHLTDAAALLRWKSKSVEMGELAPQMNRFVEACGEQKAYGLLVDLFNRRTGLEIRTKHLARLLSSSNRAVLSIAYSTNVRFRRRFKYLYQSVPEPLRRIIDESAAPLSLKATWNATHNLENVEMRLRQGMKKLGANGDEHALRELDEAAIEIYVSANRMDKALAVVLRMHKAVGASNVAICQTALMFAKQGSWGSFRRLLEILKKSDSFHFDDGTLRVFNAVIRVYCQHHSANDSWNFVATAIQDLGFTPTRSTLEIILESFVKQQQFELVPEWINFLNDIGHSTQIDVHIAVALLRRYYVDHRPSHIFMMWLCRRLILHSPSFAGDELVQLVEQAIGYDLRHLSGQYAPWQQEHAEARLARVKGLKRFIPSPGFVWNRQIYFHDSKTNQQYPGRKNGTQSPLPEILDETTRTITTEDVKDHTNDTSEISLDIEADIESLRPVDEGRGALGSRFEVEYDLNVHGRKKLEGEMWVEMSTGQYQKVLDLYHGNLDAVGIPASPIILEIAVEASLRLHQDRSKADEMISKAEEAGMNTTCASGPLLIYQLARFDQDATLDVANLREAVVSYYRANDENGWGVKHYLGVKAAHFLMIHGKVGEGLDLLSSIYLSNWAKKRPLDDVAMTVFLRGYIAYQNLTGVDWVVETVLREDIRITQKFMAQLKFLTRGNFKWMNKHPSSVHPQLRYWVERCAERREKQTEEIHKLGWNLVRNIAKSTKSRNSIAHDVPVYLEDDLFAEDALEALDSRDQDFVDESYYSDEATSESEETKRLAAIQRRMVEDWNAERDFRRLLKSAALAQGTRDKVSPLHLPDVNGGRSGELLDAEVEVGQFPVEGDLRDSAEATATAFKPFF